MNWNLLVRQSHRWLAIAFTLAIVANIAVTGRETLALWVGTLTLIPLALLLVTGLYLFFRPHVSRWRSRA
jgi:quinol-cytochrome oxidoreductase complex cytochrome b subunit